MELLLPTVRGHNRWSWGARPLPALGAWGSLRCGRWSLRESSQKQSRSFRFSAPLDGAAELLSASGDAQEDDGEEVGEYLRTGADQLEATFRHLENGSLGTPWAAPAWLQRCAGPELFMSALLRVTLNHYFATAVNIKLKKEREKNKQAPHPLPPLVVGPRDLIKPCDFFV